MRFTTTTSFVLALATLVLWAAPAGAARIVYVAGNGADTAVCGPASRPCRSIAHAVASASAGDRIVAGPGVFGGFVLDKPLTLESTHGAGATVIQGREPVIEVVAGAAGAVIGRPSKGFTIRGADTGVHVVAADVTIEDNIFTGVRLGVVSEFAAPRLSVKASVLAVAGPGATGVIARGADSEIVQNVIQGDGSGRGATLTSENAVFSDNVVTAAGVGVFVRAAVMTIRRNTFSGNVEAIELADTFGVGSSPVVISNNFLGNPGTPGGCAVLDLGGVPAVVDGNYWGNAGGEGAPGADSYCGFARVTSFLRTPVAVAAPAGR